MICGYSEAFSAIYGSDRFNALICSSEKQLTEPGLKIFNISECDYQNFSDKRAFLYLRDLLMEKIGAVIEKMPLPVVILCHNMVLAKNPALSSALRLLAQKKDRCKYRFFWVIHDLAEEGRVDMLEKTDQLLQMGISIKDELYAIGAPVHYLVPGMHLYPILKKAGFAVTLLPNPIRMNSVTSESVNRIALLEKLKEQAVSDGLTFDLQRPVCCYPTRIIRRKNVLEAILIACIFMDGNLILGVPGKSPADRALYGNLINFARENRLRVVVDTSRLPWKNLISSGQYHGNPVPYLYHSCDLALSTSLSEGFGYLLYEPWVYNKMVLARRPAGFVYPEKMSSSSLYEHMPVPLEWVCWKSIKEKYCQYSRFIGAGNCVEEAENLLRIDETVDFGILDIETQLKVLRKILSDHSSKQKMRLLFKKMAAPWWKLNEPVVSMDEAMVVKNREIIMNTFSNQRFTESFQYCTSIIPAENGGGVDFKKIQIELWKCGFKLFFSDSGGYNENITK